MKKLSITLIVILIFTNAFTIIQLNRSNSYIAHVKIELEKKDKMIAVKEKELSAMYTRISKTASEINPLDYTYLTGLNENSEDLEKVEELRNKYYINDN